MLSTFALHKREGRPDRTAPRHLYVGAGFYVGADFGTPRGDKQLRMLNDGPVYVCIFSGREGRKDARAFTVV